MNAAKSTNDGVAQTFGAVDSQLARTVGAPFIERVAADRVGKRRQRAATINFGLRAFCFQLVQNAGKFGDLLFIQFQLVGQEPQRPPHAEGTTITAAAA